MAETPSPQLRFLAACRRCRWLCLMLPVITTFGVTMQERLAHVLFHFVNVADSFEHCRRKNGSCVSCNCLVIALCALLVQSFRRQADKVPLGREGNDA